MKRPTDGVVDFALRLLDGALFVLRPDEMILVATDGHRLALVNDHLGGRMPAPVPANAAICLDASGVNWSSSRNAIACRAGSAVAAT